MTPARLMAELARALPANAIVFDEANAASPALMRYVTPAPGAYFRARGGGLGAGMAGGIGLRLAAPDDPSSPSCRMARRCTR